MVYHLSTEVLLNTLHAMAALQAMACEPDGRTVLAPVLCRERTALLAEMIKNAFVEVVLKLGPLVTDMELDGDATDAEDCRLSVELVTPSSFSTARHTVVRRAMEQTVAFTALYMWCRASVTDGAAGKAAASLADSFAAVAADWNNTLLKSLASETYPTIRE